MRTETRVFLQREGKPAIKHLILISESEKESRLIDQVVGSKVTNGDGTIANVMGVVKLTDGFREHYIRLEKAKPVEETTFWSTLEIECISRDLKHDDYLEFHKRSECRGAVLSAASYDLVRQAFNQSLEESMKGKPA